MTLQDYLDTVGRRIVDASGGTVTNAAVVDFLNEALRRLRRQIDIPTSEYVTTMKLMRGIYEYPVPSGYSDFVSITRPKVVNDIMDFTRLQKTADFYRNFTSDQNSYCEGRNGSARFALINLVSPAMHVAYVDKMNSYNGNGTWVANSATSDANTVATDSLNFLTESGSVSFTITPGQSVNNYAEIYNSTLQTFDLSQPTLKDIAMGTVFAYLPIAGVTSFTARWGTDASNYWESTVTTDISGGAFKQGWDTLGFDWQTATKVGSPSYTLPKYTLLRITYPASFAGGAGFIFNCFAMRQRLVAEFHYLSDYLLLDGTTGQPKEFFTDESDTGTSFNCDSEFTDFLTYDVMTNVFAYYDLDGNKLKWNQSRLAECEKALTDKYPSQREVPTTSYIEEDDLSLNLN